MATLQQKEEKRRENDLKKATNSLQLRRYAISNKMLIALILKKEGLSLSEIGTRMEVTPERARQLIVAAKAKIGWLAKLKEEE